MNYLKIDYAKKKGVNPSRISQLIEAGKLETVEENGRQMVVDCKANDSLFNRASWNSKRK
jgi:hypothetical protein